MSGRRTGYGGRGWLPRRSRDCRPGIARARTSLPNLDEDAGVFLGRGRGRRSLTVFNINDVTGAGAPQPHAEERLATLPGRGISVGRGNDLAFLGAAGSESPPNAQFCFGRARGEKPFLPDGPGLGRSAITTKIFEMTRPGLGRGFVTFSGECKNILGESMEQHVQNLEEELRQLPGDPRSEAQFVDAEDDGTAADALKMKYFEDLHDESSAEEEEMMDPNAVLAKLAETCGLEPGYGLGRTHKFLIDGCASGKLICLICISTIKRVDAIWDCQECYETFHLNCITRWANDSMYHQMKLNEEYPTNSKEVQWSCPKCRHHYGKCNTPNKYFCYCGKVTDPANDPWLIPHSCGQVCSRPLKPACGHSCYLLCHPGPCPPCPVTISCKCFCGKESKVDRCATQTWSCGNTCSKKLACGQHHCLQPCHEGDCPPCPKESFQPCKCRQDVAKRLCSDLIWSCGRVCGKPLICGNHVCQVECHSGPCGECPLSLPRSCPCGKSKQTLPCTEEVKTCGDTCGKDLSCGFHKCIERCHKNSCGQCMQVAVRRCKCGRREKEVPCMKMFLCDSKCKRLRDCGRHNCNKRCCSGECPPCEQMCHRTLRCKNHKCEARCHRGQCYPCTETVTIGCKCGAKKITVPCGRERKVRPPECLEPCKAPTRCHHKEREYHKCHYGPCSPCMMTCGKSYSTCDHKCQAPCHASVMQNIEKRKGQSDKLRFEMKKLPCPPCKVLVPVACLGGHETVMTPCFQAQPKPCLKPCGRLLACGNHFCTKECHPPISLTRDAEMKNEQADNLPMASNCMKCVKACNKKRNTGCSHGCALSCHPGDCPPCNKHLRLPCHCTLCELFLRCQDWTTADEKEKDKMRSCGCNCKQRLPCKHTCDKICHPGPCYTNEHLCQVKVKLYCQCKTIKKTFQCHEVKEYIDVYLPCTEACAKKKAAERKAKKAEEAKKLEEARRKQAAELEEFRRKFGKGYRKPVKEAPSTNDGKRNERPKVAYYAIISIFVAILAFLTLYAVQQSN